MEHENRVSINMKSLDTAFYIPASYFGKTPGSNWACKPDDENLSPFLFAEVKCEGIKLWQNQQHFSPAPFSECFYQPCLHVIDLRFEFIESTKRDRSILYLRSVKHLDEFWRTHFEKMMSSCILNLDDITE